MDEPKKNVAPFWENPTATATPEWLAGTGSHDPAPPDAVAVHFPGNHGPWLSITVAKYQGWVKSTTNLEANQTTT